SLPCDTSLKGTALAILSAPCGCHSPFPKVLAPVGLDGESSGIRGSTEPRHTCMFIVQGVAGTSAVHSQIEKYRQGERVHARQCRTRSFVRKPPCGLLLSGFGAGDCGQLQHGSTLAHTEGKEVDGKGERAPREQEPLIRLRPLRCCPS